MSTTDTGPCVRCDGKGTYFDRRCGDVECSECHGHGWFSDGIAGPATPDCNCPGMGKRPTDLHAPNCPYRAASLLGTSEALR